MEEARLSNDLRGWIMCGVSGIACIVGASLICIDILVRYIPGRRNFDIQRSTGFQAASYSLSFGVMIFSALYKLLPSSKNYLIAGGFPEQSAAWILLGCFSAGFVGIQVLLRIVHPYMPSHVEGCDHHHEEDPDKRDEDTNIHTINDTAPVLRGRSSLETHMNTESTPLLSHEDTIPRSAARPNVVQNGVASKPFLKSPMIEVPERVMSFVMDRKNRCDNGGPCFGYSEPCGQKCFKAGKRRPSTLDGTTSSRGPSNQQHQTHDEVTSSSETPTLITSPADEHHHHVPENAYMSTGLQTSIAIALHKLPEGFITYATNHANPSLGASVFFAIFLHNITEGFVMALPLYLALHSRTKALLWSSALGGLSQPLGAGIAAAWFKIAGSNGSQPGSTGYGCLFGVTSGIMTSVALHLFSEGLSLNHSKNLCIGFGFVGIVIIGIGNALTK